MSTFSLTEVEGPGGPVEPLAASVVPVRDSELTAGQVRTRHVERLAPAGQPGDRFDRITALAATLFGVPMSTVALVDEDTAHFPGKTGFEAMVPVARSSAFCDLAVRSGVPVVIEDVTADARFADLPMVTGPPFLRFYAGVPLDDEDGVTIGTFCLFDTVPRQLDPTQLEMLEQLAAWARRELIDSAEMERARIVQRSLLPGGTVAPDGYTMAAVCLPTKGVGGDFYDHAVVDGKLLLTLMDVMGKGVGAALVAASVRAIMRASVGHQVTIARMTNDSHTSRLTEVVAATDALVTEDLTQTGTLVTGFVAVVDPPTGTVWWVDAGHGLAVIVRADGSIERLQGNDLPIGLGLGGRWTEHRTTLSPGDTLLVVSDGLFDLLGGTAETFDEGIRYLVMTDPDPAALMERIGELTALAVALDDVTALAVRRDEGGLMSTTTPLDVHGRQLAGFAATLTDDHELAGRLVHQARLHAEPGLDDTALLHAMQVRVVSGLLSADDELARPVAADDDPDGLAAGFSALSRLERAVVSLHYGEHLDAAGIARALGSTEPEIATQLSRARARLGIGKHEAGLRHLLRARAADGASRYDGRSAIDDEVEAMFRLSVRKPPPYPSRKIVRPLIVLTAVLGLNYLIWRWIYSVHWSAWWIALPLVVAETYSLIDSMIFGFTMWRLQRRPDPGPPPAEATVDVFITTYNEPLDLVMKTARAAQRITFPHTLWILDDGNRPELQELASSEGIGVISRSSDWVDMPRHAKAGNLNNALMVTKGEFIVILDADQVPAPELLDRTLGYFRDEQMAVVQTPQFFVNVPKSDPLGSQAPLFYGPIQQGKDGWNSAFFCGSNAVLRREALLQMGIRRYVHELQIRIDDALGTAEKVIRRARARLPADQSAVSDALLSVLDAARDVRAELKSKEPIADATARFQRRVREAARRVVEQDLAGSRADLDELYELVEGQVAEAAGTELQDEALDRLARRDWSPLGAIETVSALIAAVDVDREDEAQPIMPMSTISVTEDMATCMRMHSMGWKSAYHDEVLAVGLAPEDLGTMLTQRLRWAQGTIQVMLRENPLRQKGLSVAQKIMYLGTMWSYLSGFAALAYIAAPVTYLVFGVLPVDALSGQFFARLIPFLIVNQLLFFVIGRGRSTWRGQQYSLALFPVWIKAVTSAVSNVAFGRSLSFAVTPKERVVIQKLPWRLVRPQLIAMGLLVVAAAIGVLRLVAGEATVLGTTINLIWVAFDLVLFSAVIRALFYRGFEPAESPTVPVPITAPRPAATLQEMTR